MVVRVQPGAVDVDARPPEGAPRGDVRDTAIGDRQVVQRAGALVAQDAIARHGGGHPPGKVGEGTMPDGVDTDVQRQQLARGDRAVDAPAVQPFVEELAPSDDAVLPGRQRRNGSA